MLMRFTLKGLGQVLFGTIALGLTVVLTLILLDETGLASTILSSLPVWGTLDTVLVSP